MFGRLKMSGRASYTLFNKITLYVTLRNLYFRHRNIPAVFNTLVTLVQNATANMTQRLCDYEWQPDAAQCSGSKEKMGYRLLTAPGKIFYYYNGNHVMVQTTSAANK